MKSKLLAALVISASAMFAVSGVQAQDDAPQDDTPQAQVENAPEQNYPAPPQSGPAQADPQQADAQNGQQQQGADSASGVARVSLIHGAVSTQRGDSNEWTAAALNAPIVSGDKVSTGDNSRAEVQLDFANILRLSNRAEATIATLSRNQIQVQVAQGIVNYDVFKDSEATAEIDTPNVAIHPANQDGSYRIEVRPSGETEIVVRKGQLEISTPQGSTQLNAGQDAIVRGTSTDAQYRTTDAPPRDGWDRWNSDRDHTIQSAQSWNHTDRYYTGSEDLDAYGHWGNIPDYGPVWYPSVSVGWAPYRAGRWVWEPYWGWTWVSYEPWGWAPYHYGRWFEYNDAWVWWPGPIGAGYGFGYPYRPIWAPAYVSFFGFGGGVGFGFGFGSVGWLPIGPCDPFFPWWGGYRGRFGFVDFHHFNDFHRYGGFRPLHGGERFSNLRLAATNERFRNSISVVDAKRFGTGGVHAQPMRAGMFNQAHMMGGNVPVVPTHSSLSASNRAASPSTIHNNAAGHFFGSTPRSHAEPFNRQAEQVRQGMQHFNPAQNNAHGFANNNAARATSPMENHASNENVRSGSTNNFPRPNSGAQQQMNRNAESVRGNSNPSGWHSFESNNPGATRAGEPGVERGNTSFNRSTNMQGNSGMRTNNNVPRPSNSTAPQNTDRGGWQHFTPQPRSNTAEPVGRGSYGNQPSYGNRSSYGDRSDNGYSRGNQSYGRSGYEGGYSRQPLNMRQPVVTQRSMPSPSRSSGGYSGGYHGSSGGSAPRSSGGGGGGSHGGGGGGGHSSGGGGHR